MVRIVNTMMNYSDHYYSSDYSDAYEGSHHQSRTNTAAAALLDLQHSPRVAISAEEKAAAKVLAALGEAPKPKKVRKTKDGNAATSGKAPKRTRAKVWKKELKTYHNRVKPIVRKNEIKNCIKHAEPSEYDYKYSPGAVSLVHEAAEAYVVDLLREANLIALNRGGVTVQSKDLDLARRIHGEGNVGSEIFANVALPINR